MELTEGILRQRRNLLLSCGVLWLIYFCHIGIKDISIAGLKVELHGNSDRVEATLLMVFLYFLYRYYVYFNSKILSKLKDESKVEFLAKLNEVVRAKIELSRAYSIEIVSSYDLVVSNGRVDYRVKQGSSGYSASDHIDIDIEEISAIRKDFIRGKIVNSTEFTDFLFPFLASLIVLVVYVFNRG